ncbi:MAG: hypothetical protein E7358_00305 [Clostridiales bacterium]|nr:hypothetical protein [Clostridiales bacterium]
MKKLITSKIKNEQKKYNTVVNYVYKCEQLYMKESSKAACFNCAVFEKYRNLALGDRYKQCYNCSACDNVVEAYNKYLYAQAQVDEVIKVYAKVIFEELSIIKPKLISRLDKTTVTWENVFPLNFQEVPDTLMKSIVALIEEDGGKYRIKQ